MHPLTLAGAPQAPEPGSGAGAVDRRRVPGQGARVPGKQPAMSPSDNPVDEVLDQLPSARRAEAQLLIDVMGRVTGEVPVVWAKNIVGFGRYHYQYASGREGEAPLISFASTARHHAIYLVADFAQRYHRQLTTLGKVRAGKSCLYVNRLSDVNLDVLTVLVDRTVRARRGEERADPRHSRST